MFLSVLVTMVTPHTLRPYHYDVTGCALGGGLPLWKKAKQAVVGGARGWDQRGSCELSLWCWDASLK